MLEDREDGTEAVDRGKLHSTSSSIDISRPREKEQLQTRRRPRSGSTISGGSGSLGGRSPARETLFSPVRTDSATSITFEEREDGSLSSVRETII